MRSRTPKPPPEPIPAALALLAGRSMTRAELRTRLLRKGIPETIAEEVIAELSRRRILPEDGAVLRAFGETRGARRGWGRGRTELELRKRGASGSEASRIASELVDPDVERRRLAEAVERSAARVEKSPASAKRLAARLSRQGFAAGEIRSALSRAGFRLTPESDSSRRSTFRR